MSWFGRMFKETTVESRVNRMVASNVLPGHPSHDKSQDELEQSNDADERTIHAERERVKAFVAKAGQPFNNGGETKDAAQQDTSSGAGDDNDNGSQVGGNSAQEVRDNMTIKDRKGQTNEVHHGGKKIGNILKLKDKNGNTSWVAHHDGSGEASGPYPQQQQAASAVAQSHADMPAGKGYQADVADEEETHQ